MSDIARLVDLKKANPNSHILVVRAVLRVCENQYAACSLQVHTKSVGFDVTYQNLTRVVRVVKVSHQGFPVDR